MEKPTHDESSWEAKLKKLKKKLKKKKKALAVSNERYESAQEMMGMTRQYMAEIQEKLRQQGQALEKNNKSLTDSIQYASRIQKAMFAASTRERVCFKETFMLLKPRDIVSGDAPWFYRQGDMCVAAAIDCTGHGVPGAMLTVLTLSLLNQLMNKATCDSPKKLIEQLDMLLNEYLRSTASGSRRKVRDALDIALLCYDNKDRVVRFVGTHRPLWLWQKGELHKIKGSRYSIGDADPKRIEKLEEHVFHVEEGDKAYLFTDGYPDQFGGEENFKFMLGNFYKLLEGMATKPLAEQQRLLDTYFETWRGERAQTDDVLVIGLTF